MPDTPRRPWTLTAKIGAVGGALLALALMSIGLTLAVTWQLEGGAAAVNEAGRMRMQTWRMAQALSAGDRERLQRHALQFEQSLALLDSGDPSRPLVLPRDAPTRAAFEAVRDDWQALRTRWIAAPEAPTPAAVADGAEAFVARIDQFVSAIEDRLAHWTALLNLVQLAMMGLALGAAVTLLYAAYVFIFSPLARLQSGLERVQAGEFDVRIEAGARDEFGALADGFNRMTANLQELYRGLEAKVQEKTAGLEAKRARLAALYEASALAARAGSLDELGRGFAQQIRRLARADASALRRIDEDQQRYVLFASDCLPQALVHREACVHVGDCLCGQGPQATATRVIPIAGAERATACAAAGYSEIVTVPVRLHERALGEIELFFRGEAHLDDEDRALLDALAAHLAGAMEGLRAGALEREAAVAEERSLLARELHDSIAQSLAFQKIQVQLLRDALRRGDSAQTERVLAELDAGVRESTADVRELLVHFRTRTTAEDLVPALQTTLAKFEHQSGVATDLRVQGHGLPLDADVQVQVLHVVQEALSNVRKHAQATRVVVELERAPRWRVRVRDDGRGFLADGAPSPSQVGLRIMRERAERIGAAVSVSSAPGGGTCVELTLPLPAAQARSDTLAA
jgi:two-component system nitrate/nitrite sensor histidine kinase NarX